MPAQPPDLSGVHHDVLVIGGGQAGLSMSWCLRERGVDHLVLERARVAQDWRERRWDSFCLVTPNWQCRLPGFPYAGDDPHGFMAREEIVDYLEAYAASFDPPLMEGVEVTALCAASERDGRFSLQTTAGGMTAGQVVMATGPYRRPKVPEVAARLHDRLVQVHSGDYRNPESLPDGDVLVVGTGQSGCQIAEDLHLAGRRVHLAVGGAPRVARRYRGREVVDWLDEMGHYDLPVDEHPQGERVRRQPNHYVTGRDGGRDIDLRRFALEGMRLYGRLADVDGDRLRFARDLRANLDAADAVSDSIKDAIDEHISERGLDAPTEERYTPVWEPPRQPDRLDLGAAGVTAVIWSTGFDTDWTWVDLPAFDGGGYPTHERGVTSVPGLYVLGLPWLYTWGSGRFSGIARDADHLAEVIRASERPGRPRDDRDALALATR